MKESCAHDPHTIAVIAKFPTAMANWDNISDPGTPQMWWISDNTGTILSETYPSGAQITFPDEQDAWDSAYLFSVRGVTFHQVQVEAFLLWELTGRPEGTALENWLDAKGDLETPPSPPPPPPVE